MSMRKRALVLVALAVVIGGCSQGGATPPAQQSDIPFEEMVAKARADAVEAGASDAQLADLDRALADGGISFEDAHAAVERAVACMNDVGVTAAIVESERVPGLRIPGYSVYTSEDNFEAMMNLTDPCDKRENYYTSYLYQSQPSSQRLREQNIENHRPELVACLNRNGVTTDESQTPDELVRAAIDLIAQSFEAGAEEPIDCLYEAGINGA